MAQEIQLVIQVKVLCGTCIIIGHLVFTFRAYNIDEYPCKTKQAAAIMLMIMNNLDPRVAQV